MLSNVIDIKSEEIVKIKNKTLKEKSFIMDINIIEAPLFRFGKTSITTTVKDLIEDKDISKELKYILNRVKPENRCSTVDFRSWIDSKGVEREIVALSMNELPNAFAMDVFYALIALYIKKHAPINYDEKTDTYEFNSNSVEFTMVELCDLMGLNIGGRDYQRIKDAIVDLNAVKYYSLAKGVFYNKRKERYETSKEKSINLITNYDFTCKKGRSTTEKCIVRFDDLVMENMKYRFAKFLNTVTYFQLKTGLTRRLYSYIEGTRHNKKYIKRNYEVLRNKIPIEFNYPSILKRKLNKALDNLVIANYIKGYFYGDEIKINNVKESCIYIIFEGTAKEVIESLTKKKEIIKIEKKKEVKDKSLVFPENIGRELRDFKINENKISELMSKNSKYELAKYILWMKDGMSKGKVKDPAALFVFAMTPAGENNGNMVTVENSNPEIVKFVEDYKSEIEGKKAIDENLMKETFNKYIEDELSKFIDEEEFAYMSMRDSVLGDIEKIYKKKIKSQHQLYNIASSSEEKDEILKTIDRWEKYPIEKEKSEIFKDELIKRASLYRGFKNYENFKIDYIKKNK